MEAAATMAGLLRFPAMAWSNPPLEKPQGQDNAWPRWMVRLETHAQQRSVPPWNLPTLILGTPTQWKISSA
jgi:hypothetical protein